MLPEEPPFQGGLVDRMTKQRPYEHQSGRGLKDDPRASPRGTATLGFGLSAVVHLVVILMYSLGPVEWAPRENTLGVESDTRAFDGMRIVQVVEIAPEDDQPTDDEPEVVLEIVPAPEAPVQGPERAGGLSDEGLDREEEVRRGFRAADALKVRSSDTRLWRAALPEIFELTEAERLQLELAGLLEAWHDSVTIAFASEAALTDWTMTDAEGNRWGVSKGQLHLGSLTLPLPVSFGGNMWQAERASRRAWEDADILGNLNSQAARASWGERANAIRERKDRLRREADQQPDSARTSGGGPPR